MVDIKTREAARRTIKKLDRATSYTHRMKEATVRSKISEIGKSRDSDNANSYANEVVEHYAGDGALYAAQAGVELVIKSRQKSPKLSDGSAVSPDQIDNAFRTQGIKKIRDRQQNNKLADIETLQNAGKSRCGDRVSSTHTIGNKAMNRGGMSTTGRNRRKAPKAANNCRSKPVQKMQREYGIRKLKKRYASKSNARLFATGGTKKTSKSVMNNLRRIIRDSSMLFKTLTAGGTVCIGIITVMVLFGAALNMTENGGYIVGTGDTEIVEVARDELGNVGGKKYWKWYGFTSRVDWCAIFCSWCANQCGYLDSGTLPRFAVVGDGADWFKTRHRWAGRGYTPKPGDFIFFDYEHDGLLNHVGIVESCDGKTITTIEGNSGDACKRNYYTVGSYVIAGYGISIQTSAIPGSANYSAIAKACQEQSIWMKDAEYAWEKHPTIAKSKKKGSCVTYVACVLQRIGYLESGKYIWHTGSGYGNGKVYGTTDNMTTTYMDNKSLKSLKSQLQAGDIVLVDDNKSGESGSGGHVFIITGEWSGNDPYIWDNFTASEGQKPRAYNGNRKVLAIVRLK